MSSSQGTPPAFDSRRFLVPAGLLLVALVASRFTAFRTSVRLTSQGGRLELTVNGRTVRGEARLGRFRGVRIETVNSVFPMGGEALTLSTRSGILLRDRLPRRFSLAPGKSAPLGDWYVDEAAGGGLVYERAVDAPPDFVLDATFTGRCLEYTSVVLVGEPSVSAQFRRGLLNNDFVLSVGGRILGVDALVSPLDQMAINALDLVVRGVAAGCVLVLVFTAAGALLARGRDGPLGASLRRAWSGAKRHWPVLTAAAVAVIALAIRLWTSRGVLEALAHTPDEVAYILQSKWIVSNRIYQIVSPIQDYLSVPFTYVRDGKWFAMYPIGWPLLLAIGQIVGLPWVVGPMLGAAYVFVLFLIGKELYGELGGLGAAVLAAFSPMAILMSSSYLSHAPAAVMITLFLWLFLVARRRNSPWLCALSGASLGFAFAIRPATALALAVPFAFVLLREIALSDRKSDVFRLIAAFIVGGLLGSAPFFLSNHAITGDALSSAYGYGANVGFSSQNVPAGLMYLDATAASVLPAVFGWGWGTWSGWLILSLSFAFAVVPFVLGRAGRFDVLLAAFLVTLPLSFLEWGFHGLHGYGPRFYFEAFLGLYLLTSRGILLLAGLDGDRPVRFRLGRAIGGASIALFALLTFSTVATLRARLELYRGYNWVDGSLEKAIERQGLKKAFVLLPSSDWFPWGAASNLLGADVDADLAFGVSRPDNSKLLAFYSDRPAYVWSGAALFLVAPPRSPGSHPPPGPSGAAGRVTPLLAYWIGFWVIGMGGVILLFRDSVPRRASERPAPSPVAPLVEPVEPVVRAAQSIDSPLDRKMPAESVRPIRALAGVFMAYVGQILLTPGGLAPRLASFGLSGRPLFHAGWLLLLVGAIVFGTSLRVLAPDSERESPERKTSPDEGRLDRE
jgi:hypothetical protein